MNNSLKYTLPYTMGELSRETLSQVQEISDQELNWSLPKTGSPLIVNFKENNFVEGNKMVWAMIQLNFPLVLIDQDSKQYFLVESDKESHMAQFVSLNTNEQSELKHYLIEVTWDETNLNLIDYERGETTVEDRSNLTLTVNSSSTDNQYPSAKAVFNAIQGGGGGADTEKIINKVTELSSQSTDIQYPSAKCVYNAIKNIPVAMQFKGSLGGGELFRNYLKLAKKIMDTSIK